MSISARDFLTSAESLAVFGLDEINQRNAISRAYYAAYHRAKNEFAPDGKVRGVGMHRGYIQQLKEADRGTLERKIGVSLGVIYSSRIISDYQLDKNVTSSDFSQTISRAKILFELLDKTAPAPATNPLTHLRVIN